MKGLASALEKALPHESYLHRWVAHREMLEPFPEDFTTRWAPRFVVAYRTWLEGRTNAAEPLFRQETFLRSAWEQGRTDLREELLTFLSEVYPEAAARWAFLSASPVEPHRRAFFSSWDDLREKKDRLLKERRLSVELPGFHSQLTAKLRRAQKGDATVRSLLTDRDFGWDLEDGITEELDWEPLAAAAAALEKDPELRRIAEIIGRDWRASRQPPEPPPRENRIRDPEPGKSEILGVTWGRSWADILPQEASLLGETSTSILFFLKEAEGRLLTWDYHTAAAPRTVAASDSRSHRTRNDRGPLIAVLDTSGSMRGKPEAVAKAAVLALVRVAWEEDRSCYLVNFSSKVRALDVTDLKHNLRPFLDFLKFSFHGGTDLAPALKEALKVLREGKFRDADVLVLSDFATPKIPGPVRVAIRDRQENAGTRFYSLTVSSRPLNDFLNIFDAGWIYDVHPDRPGGVNPEALRFAVD